MKKFVLSLVLMIAGSMLIQAQQANAVASPNGPQITFEKTTHDYGTIFTGSNGEYEFVFTNTGNEPLILSQPRSSCGCTVPAWPRKPLLPGEKEKIKVTYNTGIKGRFQKTVTIVSNATNNNALVLTIKGEVVDKPAEAMPEKTSAPGASPNSR